MIIVGGLFANVAHRLLTIKYNQTQDIQTSVLLGEITHGLKVKIW